MGHEAEVHHLAVMSCGRGGNWSVSVQTPNLVVVWGLILPDEPRSGCPGDCVGTGALAPPSPLVLVGWGFYYYYCYFKNKTDNSELRTLTAAT